MIYLNWKYCGVIETIQECSTRAEAKERQKICQLVIGVGTVYISKNATVAWRIKSRESKKVGLY